MSPRIVHAKKGTITHVRVRSGVAIEVAHFASGAVVLKNAATGAVIRSWGPKDRDSSH